MSGVVWRRFLSRKFLVAVGGGLVSFLAAFWPEHKEFMEQAVILAIAYIVSQGVVDVATEAKGVRDEHR